MVVRPYKPADKEKCIAIFQSNCPNFFDKDELPPFIKWLDHQGTGTPAYSNSEKDEYSVIEVPGIGIIACGGFYIVKGQPESRLAWGMIHAHHHRHGYGTVLYNYRAERIKKNWPQHSITLGTSQHTFLFYQKMGMDVTATFKDGYGPGLDRYDMTN
jgi:[ribosomal protein S18]-alanine N-acetyltransferase